MLLLRNDVNEDNDTGSSENAGDCSEVLGCTDVDSEAMKHDTVTEEEESIQVRERASCVYENHKLLWLEQSILEIQVSLTAVM